MSFSIGAPQGWREEIRSIGDGRAKTIICRGEHARLCRETADGYVCASDCQVKDMRSLSRTTRTVDELVTVEEGIWRRRWRGLPTLVHEWCVARVSLRRTFVNGRSHGEPDYSRSAWYEGRAWLRRRALREMRAAIEGDRASFLTPRR